MNKSIPILAALLLTFMSVTAQNLSDYTYRTGIDAARWITLTSPDTIFSPNAYYDDNASSALPIGFSFFITDEIYDSFSVSTNGVMHLGAAGCDASPDAGKLNAVYAAVGLPKICGVARDLSTGNRGYIISQLVGAAPGRVLVCEFALARDYSSSLPPDLRWQVQLHEDSNKIIIACYGAMPAAPPQAYQAGLAASISDIRLINPLTHRDSICRRPCNTEFNVWHGPWRYYEYVRPMHGCPQPATLTATATIDSALVTWSAPSAASSWVIEYKDSPFTPGCGQGQRLLSRDTSLLLTGLIPNTLYHLYIHSDCGTDTSLNIHTTFSTRPPLSTCPPPRNCRITRLSTTEAVLHWQETGTALMWLVEWDTAGFRHGTGHSSVVNADSIRLTGLSPATLYDVYIYPSCGIDSVYLQHSFCTEGLGDLHIMRAGTHTITACSATITDNGGPSGHYSANSYDILTLQPTAGNTITLQGTCSTELNYDFLDIFDGPSTGSPRLAHISGNSQAVGPFTATSGPLTLLFTSDASVHNAGFSLTARCTRLSSCPVPYNLTVDSTSTTSISVSFDDTAAVGSYTLCWSSSGNLYQPTGSITVSTTHHTIANLQTATTYHVWVRANCPSDSSLWQAFPPVTTGCGLSYATPSMPFVEDFETGSIPVCWSQNNIVGNAAWRTGTPAMTPGSAGTPHSGSQCLVFYGNDGTTTRLITPLIDISTLSTPQLSFWHIQEAWGNDQDVLTVYCRRSAASPWTLLATYTASIDSWTQELIDLPLSMNTCQIAFQGEDNYGFGIMLDDVAIRGAVTPCPPPTSVTANAGGHIALVSWPDSGRFNLTYKEFADTMWQPAINVNGSSHLLGGLRPETAYNLRLRTDCSDNQSDWISTVFITQHANLDTTVLPCPPPAGLTLDSNGVSWADISWLDDDSHNTWLMQLRGGRTLDTAVTTNRLRLRGLLPNTTYTISLQSLCDSTRHSLHSDTITFTTDSGDLETIRLATDGESTIVLCPNPATQGWFDVLLHGGNSYGPLTVTMCDAAGRTILRQTLTDQYATRHRITLPTLPAGIYIVSISTAKSQSLHRIAIMPGQ